MEIKYPQTAHLDFSQSIHSDDITLSSLQFMWGHDVVCTEKKDGENTTLRRDRCHARSLDSRTHPSRDWIKAFHGQIAHLIPEGYRICGENVYAHHSIFYENLESYFYGFSVWDGLTALSWDESLQWFEELGITPVPVMQDEQGPLRGTFDKAMYARLVKLSKTLDTTKHEGFVVRVTDSIHHDEFKNRLAKWVRKNHVQTDEHWMSKPVVPNQLKEKA